MFASRACEFHASALRLPNLRADATSPANTAHRIAVLNVTLEAARGLAALWVFSYHISELLRASSPTLGSIAEVGHLGVPAFFVISGYCMMATSERIRLHGDSALSFIFWRFLRIFPPYWYSILVVMAVPYMVALLSYVKSGFYEWPMPRWLAFTAADWGTVLSLTRGFFTPGERPQDVYNAINSVYWTLAIEFQFYLVLFLALRYRRHFDRILVGVTILGVGAAAIPAMYTIGLFLPFWPMFSLGIGLHRFLAHTTSPRPAVSFRRVIGGCALAAAIAATFFYLTVSGRVAAFWSHSPNLCDFLFAVACTIVFFLSAAIDPANFYRWLDRSIVAKYGVKALTLLGAISYSLYLIHGKISEVPFMFARQIVTRNSLLTPFLTLAGTLLLTSIFFVYCERPFIRTRTRRASL